jgi:hypothetical protein
MESKQPVAESKVTRINCNDATLQQQVLNKHRITQAKYNSMVDDFFNSSVPAKQIPAQAIHDLIMHLDCNEFKLKLEADENDMQSNGEIDLDVEQVKRFQVHYSLVLFKALLNNYNPTEVHFAKAIGADEFGTRKYDVVFVATQGNVPVYYGDLSDLIP